MKYIPRLLVAPFIFAILLIDSLIRPFVVTYGFIKNGGEVLPYGKNDQKRIHDIYELLSKELEEKKRGN